MSRFGPSDTLARKRTSRETGIHDSEKAARTAAE
jgi:hypothetical protein